jgi:hypothetical protein
MYLIIFYNSQICFNSGFPSCLNYHRPTYYLCYCITAESQKKKVVALELPIIGPLNIQINVRWGIRQYWRGQRGQSV